MAMVQHGLVGWQAEWAFCSAVVGGAIVRSPKGKYRFVGDGGVYQVEKKWRRPSSVLVRVERKSICRVRGSCDSGGARYTDFL